MDVVIIADYCGGFDGGFNSRFLYLSDVLCKEGHEVEIITSDFDHGRKRKFDKLPSGFPYRITMLRELGYKKNICIKRFASDFYWGEQVRKYLKNRKKPDVVYAAVPPLKGAYDAAVFCEKNNVRLIIDVQDLWPEAYRMVFHVPIISDLLFAPFTWIANGIYKRADEICGVSKTYAERAKSVNRKVNQVHPVFLGTDLSEFDRYVQENRLKREDQGELWLGYCGSMGDSYDLACVIDALSIVKNAPTLIAMGDGQKKDEWIEYAKIKNVNARFYGMLPYSKMCGVLAACDMVINPIAKDSAASIINKHADYAAVGLPVLNTQESLEYRELVSRYKMGLNSENGNPNELAHNIEILMNDAELRREMGINARKCAEEMLNRKSTYKNLVDLISVGGGIYPLIKPNDEIWIVYCGTLGASYDLNIIFSALNEIKDDRYKLIIMGDGPRRKEFEDNATGLNVIFTGLLPYQVMCGVLSACDIAVNPIMKGAAQSIINKHGDYAAAGLPVVNTQECQEYRDLIDYYKMGFNCCNNNSHEIAEVIQKLDIDVNMRRQMGENARKCAEELFDRKRRYLVLHNLINSQCQ